MSFEAWIVYVTAVLIMMSTPGPSQLLMLTNSATNGFRRSSFTLFGDLTANVCQMLAAGLGLAAILLAFEHALIVIKWAGVAYLLWLGIKKLRDSTALVDATLSNTTPASIKTLWLQGFITSAANPKAVVFFAALFPQFIDPNGAFWLQFSVLSTTYVVIDGTILSAYGISASWLSERLRGPTRVWLDRIGGSFLILAAILLGMKSMRQS